MGFSDIISFRRQMQGLMRNQYLRQNQHRSICGQAEIVGFIVQYKRSPM